MVNALQETKKVIMTFDQNVNFEGVLSLLYKAGLTSFHPGLNFLKCCPENGRYIGTGTGTSLLCRRVPVKV
jgi:hypothetical protein